jgi:hypothetical protein
VIFKGEALAESDATSPPATQEETTHNEAERGEDGVDEESVEPSTQSGKAIANLMHK